MGRNAIHINVMKSATVNVVSSCVFLCSEFSAPAEESASCILLLPHVSCSLLLPLCESVSASVDAAAETLVEAPVAEAPTQVTRHRCKLQFEPASCVQKGKQWACKDCHATHATMTRNGIFPAWPLWQLQKKKRQKPPGRLSYSKTRAMVNAELITESKRPYTERVAGEFNLSQCRFGNSKARPRRNWGTSNSFASPEKTPSWERSTKFTWLRTSWSECTRKRRGSWCSWRRPSRRNARRRSPKAARR